MVLVSVSDRWPVGAYKNAHKGQINARRVYPAFSFCPVPAGLLFCRCIRSASCFTVHGSRFTASRVRGFPRSRLPCFMPVLPYALKTHKNGILSGFYFTLAITLPRNKNASTVQFGGKFNALCVAAPVSELFLPVLRASEALRLPFLPCLQLGIRSA